MASIKSCVVSCICVLGFNGLLRAAEPVTTLDQDLLARAVSANQDLYASLESFVCREQIERFKGRVGSTAGRQLDSVNARVSFENGTEHYSELRRQNRALLSLQDLDGAWSEGEFGTLLKQTEQLLSVERPRFEKWDDVDGTAAGLYRMETSRIESPWDLEVGARHFTIPFRTKFWVSRSSGEIIKIVRTSIAAPAELHIAEITWGVTLTQVDLNGKQWLLPKSGEYEVLYERGDRREWNTMEFSDYHRYGAEVALRFE